MIVFNTTQKTNILDLLFNNLGKTIPTRENGNAFEKEITNLLNSDKNMSFSKETDGLKELKNILMELKNDKVKIPDDLKQAIVSLFKEIPIVSSTQSVEIPKKLKEKITELIKKVEEVKTNVESVPMVEEVETKPKKVTDKKTDKKSIEDKKVEDKKVEEKKEEQPLAQVVANLFTEIREKSDIPIMVKKDETTLITDTNVSMNPIKEKEDEKSITEWKNILSQLTNVNKTEIKDEVIQAIQQKISTKGEKEMTVEEKKIISKIQHLIETNEGKKDLNQVKMAKEVTLTEKKEEVKTEDSNPIPILNQDVKEKVNVKTMPLSDVGDFIRKEVQQNFDIKVFSPKKMIVQLNPENLGKIEISFEKQDDGTISATFNVEDKKVQEEVEKVITDIKQELKDKGVDFQFQIETREDKENEKRKEQYDRPKNDKKEKVSDSVFDEKIEQIMGG